jgi:carbamate kinase
MSKTVVIALGGNALQKNGEASASKQQIAADQTAKNLAPLVKEGFKIAIVHGNGPQVGNIVLHEEAINTKEVPTMPLDSDVAMSQGLIGYWLQQSMQEEMFNIGVDASSATIITQVEVAKNDPGFSNPSKPIGPFYESLEEAKEKSGSNNTYIEDSGRGWRRVVPSPRPIRIIEIETIKKMMNAGVLVITAGGGGVPVIVDDNKITGIEAVIDKDHAASFLAEQLDAEKLIILTSVSGVSINYGKPDEKLIESATVEEMKKYVRDGYFAAGSMLPKVLAAIKFVESGPNRETIIASLDDASAALKGQSGTSKTLH